MKTTYPGALYAKRLTGKDPAGKEYSWQFIHPQFETPFLHELRHRLQQFQWRSGDGIFAPIMGWQNVSSGNVLIVRYMDDGKDSLGRPHCIRIEILLVPLAEAPAVIQTIADMSDQQ